MVVSSASHPELCNLGLVSSWMGDRGMPQAAIRPLDRRGGVWRISPHEESIVVLIDLGKSCQESRQMPMSIT